MEKTKSPSDHFDERLKERYKIKLKRKDKLQIKAGILKDLYKVSNRQGTRTCYLVPYKGRELRLVFDHSNNEFVTALKLNKHENWRRGQTLLKRRAKKYKVYDEL